MVPAFSRLNLVLLYETFAVSAGVASARYLPQVVFVFFFLNPSWSSVICSVKNRYFRCLQNTKTSTGFSVRSLEKVDIQPPPNTNPTRTRTLHCSLLCSGEMCLHLKFSKDLICSERAASIYSFYVWRSVVSPSGCLGVLQPLPSGHMLCLKYLAEPAVGTERSPHLKRCSREEQPKGPDHLVLRHHHTPKAQGWGRQPGLHRGQGGLGRRRQRKCTSNDEVNRGKMGKGSKEKPK